jgi:hypothetical protein
MCGVFLVQSCFWGEFGRGFGQIIVTTMGIVIKIISDEKMEIYFCAQSTQ